eukprot:scaffold177305_cov51-Prasinocladus_malaysianus.AAC.1
MELRLFGVGVSSNSASIANISANSLHKSKQGAKSTPSRMARKQDASFPTAGGTRQRNIARRASSRT